jgi:hypothetical protein
MWKEVTTNVLNVLCYLYSSELTILIWVTNRYIYVQHELLFSDIFQAIKKRQYHVRLLTIKIDSI